MVETGKIASYLPKSMVICVGPDLQIFDEHKSEISIPTATAFGYFFHEYVHYLHNISTVSGIAAFINTMELWRCFRLTMKPGGHSAGSAAFSPDQKSHLGGVLLYLRAARRRHDPSLRVMQPWLKHLESHEESVAKTNPLRAFALRFEGRMRKHDDGADSLPSGLSTMLSGLDSW